MGKLLPNLSHVAAVSVGLLADDALRRAGFRDDLLRRPVGSTLSDPRLGGGVKD